MIIVAGLSIKNLEPRVWDSTSKYYLPDLRAVMVSYAEFHQLAARRQRAMDVGLHKFLGVPKRVKVYLDNGAFYFLRQKGEAERKKYTDFIKRAKPDWYPIPFDSIPTPQMCDDGQRECFKRTMQYNYWYQHDGYVPVIHISRHLNDYIDRMKANVKLNAKQHIALGGIVPNLLRTPKALAYSDIIETLERVRSEFKGKKLHVFGIGGTSTLHLGALLGMDSVDSSGWRNRAARGIVQMPGSGDRVVSDLGSWRGRIPTEREWSVLEKCPCPACVLNGVDGLKTNGLAGFCNRATHNLHVLLDEADWVDKRLKAGTYKRCYKRRLDNSVYLPIIERLVNDLF